MTAIMKHSSRLVESARNTAIQRARALEGDAKERRRSGLYIAWGRHLAMEALDARAEIDTAFVSSALDRTAEGRRIWSRLQATGRRLIRTRPRLLDRIVAGSADQGIVLLIRRRAYALEDLAAPAVSLVVVAHGVQDPGNLGSIARSTLALSADALVTLEGCADPYGSRVVRAAMGAHFRLPILCASSRDCLAALRHAQLAIAASDPEGTIPPDRADLVRRVAILVGSEGRGLPAPLLRESDQRIRIPMRPGISSLNVHAATAILLAEAGRQRGYEDCS